MKAKMPNRIETVTHLVAAFGGTSALAAWLDVVPSTVSNWNDQDFIPTGWHLRIYLECQRKGLHVSPKLFGLEDAHEEVKRKPRPKARTGKTEHLSRVA